MTKIDYPAALSIDYPGDKRNRLTCFFRIFVAIPILIILALVLGGTCSWAQNGWTLALGAGGIIFLATLLMILFRQKYPRWWFDWNLALTKFSFRVSSFLYRLRDEYPSTDEEQSVDLKIDYPDAKKDINRWLPLVKWFLAIPHYIILCFLYVAVFIVLIVAWFSILFTRKFPKGMWEFVVAVMQWSIRVSAYAFLLVTDKYPPFALED